MVKSIFTGVQQGGVEDKATVYIRIDDKVTSFHSRTVFRDSVPQIIPQLCQRFGLSLLSGDNDKMRNLLGELFGKKSDLLFEQKPIDKLQYIEKLQGQKKRVLMIGDGLNDAGALQQSNVGITLADDINNFTPSCDAILDSKRFSSLPAIMKLAKDSRYIIGASFAVSVIYNLAGLFFAMQGILRPMVAAILMPCSTISIVVISSGASSLLAKGLGLRLKSEEIDK